jgi:very-short-patch-repair endonuclease
MNHLTELLERLQHAETAYKTSKSSLDNSLEYVLCREDLKQCRFRFDKACREYVLVNLFGHTIEEEVEL